MSNQAIEGGVDTVAYSKLKQTLSMPFQNNCYILSVALNEAEGMIAFSTTESLIYFYRMFGNNQDFRLFKIVCMCAGQIGCQTNIWYLEKHKTWFTSSNSDRKCQLREWKVSKT